MRTEKEGNPPLWRDGFLWLTLLLSLFAAAPFLLPGYHWGANDARHHVYFLFEFDRLVQDGIWWPRWSPDFAFGYGYPFFNIYAPGSHFLAEIFLRVFGLNFTAAIEAVFVLGLFGSAAAMYGYIRSLVGRSGALIAALLYTYAPYHLLLLYVRANLAEASAFLWLPLCLWSFRNVVLRPGPAAVVGAALSYAGLMLTSNLVFVLFSPLLVLYILALLIASRGGGFGWVSHLFRRGWPPLSAALLGLGLSAIFWIPMALERGYVRVDQWFDGRYDFRDDFLYFFQLFSPRWGFGVSQAGPDDEIGFQIGSALLLLGILGALIGWRKRPLRPEIVVLGLGGLGGLLVGLQPFAPLWDLPLLGTLLGFAQFPWRWLPLTVLALSVLGGLFLADHRRRLDLGLLTLAITVLLTSYPLIRIEIREPAEGPVGLAALMRFERDADELTGSTAWVKEIPTWSPMAEYYINQDEAGLPVTPVTSKIDYENIDYESLAVGSVAHNTVMEELYFCTNPGERPGDCTPKNDTRVIFNHFYYPGWRAYLLDDSGGQPIEELEILPEEEGTLGRMTVQIPPVGEGYIRLEYGDTPPRRIGRLLSQASVVITLAIITFGLWKRRKEGG